MDTETMQDMIDSGLAWQLEGSVGRAAMQALENGDCVLGHVGHFDYYGGYVPSRYEVAPGTMGSLEYAGRACERTNITYTVNVEPNTGERFTMHEVPVALLFGRMLADLKRGNVQAIELTSWEGN